MKMRKHSELVSVVEGGGGSSSFHGFNFNYLISILDSETGLITTLLSLDREAKSSYKIIIEVSDDGQPPQSATRVLHINVLDIDDHLPRFNREIVSDCEIQTKIHFTEHLRSSRNRAQWKCPFWKSSHQKQ